MDIFCKILVSGDDAVAYSVVLRLRDHVASYEFIRISKGTLRDDATGVALGDSGQVEKVFAGGIVDVDSLVAAHAFLDAFGHGFGIPAHGFGGFGGTPADFIRIVAIGGAGRDAGQRKQREDY